MTKTIFFRLEARKTWLLPLKASLKKGIIGTGYSTQAFLKDPRIVTVNIWPLSSDIFQLCALRKEVNRLSANLIGITSLLKCGVVKLTAKIEELLEFSNHMLRGTANFELIGFQLRPMIASNYLFHKRFTEKANHQPTAYCSCDLVSGKE